MKPTNQKAMLSEQSVESLLLQMRPGAPDEALHPRVDDLTKRRITGEVLAQWEDGQIGRSGRPVGFRKLSVVALAAALSAASLVFVMYTYFIDQTPQMTHAKPVAVVTDVVSKDAIAVVPRSRFALLQGDVHCGDTAVQLGAGVPADRWIETGTGQSAFALPTGIGVGLADESAARVFWQGKRRYEVELSRGMALFSVDPQSRRDGFSVRTPRGVIEVTGTLFTVVVKPDGAVAVHLHKGAVRVKTSAGTKPVAAGETATFSKGKSSVVSSKKNKRVAGQLYRMGCIDGGAVFSELSSAACGVASRDNNRSIKRKGRARGPKVELPNISLEEKQPLWTVRELLQAGRSASMEGKWEEAAVAYKALIRDYPGSPDSRTALVSLAQVELRHMGSPKAALAHFNAYLRGGGALSQEAMWGKSKAFAALGDSDSERRVLEQLMVTYPNGTVAKAARQRLNQLSSF